MPLGANKAAIMGVSGVSTADVVLINTLTATSDASLSFTSGIDSTYGEYIFGFYNMGPETANTKFTFQCSIDAGSNYNVAITSTYFRAKHAEGDSTATLDYFGDDDAAQGTGFHSLAHLINADADRSAAGVLHIFNPSSTTYAKQFFSETHHAGAISGQGYVAVHSFAAGYINTTDNIDAIQFKMASGDFDGKIKMWGVK